MKNEQIEKLLDTRCKHESGIEKDFDKTVSDYKPLTKPEKRKF